MNHKMIYVVVLLLGLHATASTWAQEREPVARVGKPTEVVFVATQHFITDMPEGYTPGHLRALLKKMAPGVLAVEAPANVPDPWQFAPFDLWNVTRPWADENHVQAIPIGWHEPQYQAQLAQMFQVFQATGKAAEYQKIEQDFQSSHWLGRSAEQSQTRASGSCEHMNSDAAQGLWREYHAGLHQLYAKNTPWEEWNAKILANLLRVCRQHKGKRIAVVFGGAHCYYLQDHLAGENGIRVIPTKEFFPLSVNDVELQTRPTDYVKALRLLNFGVVAPDVLGRLKRFLDKVHGYPQFQGDYHLFRGKYLLHRQEASEALNEFQKLAAVDAGAVSAFDGQSLLRETGLVYAAIAKSRLGRCAEARRDLEAIIQKEDVTPGTKQWAQQVLNNLPG